jgi:hypothetical protein
MSSVDIEVKDKWFALKRGQDQIGTQATGRLREGRGEKTLQPFRAFPLHALRSAFAFAKFTQPSQSVAVQGSMTLAIRAG